MSQIGQKILPPRTNAFLQWAGVARRPMSSTAGGEVQGGRFGAKEVRTRGLPLVATFYFFCTNNLMA